ncbi:hypothetical protein PMIN01_05195 [Paraphaeosphaeria minitans]|uniref:Uncharacterized protein n=1 Tax=Paraphaeosphaeria minitans TaxID=565426 RepID=A0A9P6GLH0_9PLEO|nr:hypothetical protein PMIN01_05195 [Paraphaeosphaeria minitans]
MAETSDPVRVPWWPAEVMCRSHSHSHSPPPPNGHLSERTKRGVFVKVGFWNIAVYGLRGELPKRVSVHRTGYLARVMASSLALVTPHVTRTMMASRVEIEKTSFALHPREHG